MDEEDGQGAPAPAHAQPPPRDPPLAMASSFVFEYRGRRLQGVRGRRGAYVLLRELRNCLYGQVFEAVCALRPGVLDGPKVAIKRMLRVRALLGVARRARDLGGVKQCE